MRLRTYSRRDFLRETACGAAAAALGMTNLAKANDESVVKRSTVVLVRDERVLDAEGRCDATVMAKMLDDALIRVTGEETATDAWSAILKEDDTLGIKTNFWPSLRTPEPLEQAIRDRALGVGIKEDRIAIDDWHVLQNPIFEKASALINARPLRTHHWAGIGGCLKNYIMFSPKPSDWHEDSCADLGGLWKLPICAGKTRLNILIVLTPLFYGIGPHHYDPQHVWQYKGLLVGTDPVALDAMGVRLLEAKRKQFFERPPRGGTSTKHVRFAETRHGVGVADLNRIDLVRLGWMDDVLI